MPSRVNHHDNAPAGSAQPPIESRTRRAERGGRRAVPNLAATTLVLLLIVLVALIVANNQTVELSGILDSTRDSLVLLLTITAILGWIAGIATAVLLRNNRRPKTR